MSELEIKLQNAIKDYKENYNNNNALLNFVNQELKENQQAIIDLIPILIENTDRANYRWIDNIKLCRTNGFIEKIIENIGKFDFDKINFSENILQKLFNNLSKECVLTDQFMLNLDKTNISENTYLKIYRSYDIYNGDKGYNLLINGFDLYNNPEIIKALTKKAIESGKIELICNNIDKIIESYNNPFELNKITNKNEGANNKVKEYIENNPKESVAKILASQMIDEYVTYNNKILKRENYSTLEVKLEEESLTEIIYLIIKEICENENIKISDIYKIGEGATSDVFEIGNKVFKIGTEKITHKFHNNPYIMQPLLRKTFIIGHWDQKIITEVYEKGNTKTEITEEELYELYKKVRNIGLIWTDVGPKNVARLTKENVIHWNKNLQPSDEALELDEYIDGPKLKIGDLIIIDNDFIFKGDMKEWQPRTELATKFENRYQQEKTLEQIEIRKK